MNLASLTVLAQDDAANQAGQLVGMVIYLAIVIVAIIGMWKMFEKAGKPGWAAIVPIYNMIVLLEIVGRPVWWIVLMLIPCVNFIFVIIIYSDLSKSFGKGIGYTLGLLFLPFIFFPLLGFGDARYVGPATKSA